MAFPLATVSAWMHTHTHVMYLCRTVSALPGMSARGVAVSACLLAVVALSGCASHKDANMCDFYHSLGADYTQSQGYVPSSVQDEIDQYC